MHVVKGILNTLLNKQPIEIDRAHRAAGPPRYAPRPPRDIICHIHFSNIKEEILRAARARSPLEWDGAEILILLDLSRCTLEMRKMVKPLLEVILESGATYRWGFPFHIIIRKGANTV